MRLPRHVVCATVMLVGALHVLVAKPAAHVPVGVPYDAKSTAVMTCPTRQRRLPYAFSATLVTQSSLDGAGGEHSTPMAAYLCVPEHGSECWRGMA